MAESWKWGGEGRGGEKRGGEGRGGEGRGGEGRGGEGREGEGEVKGGVSSNKFELSINPYKYGWDQWRETTLDLLCTDAL